MTNMSAKWIPYMVFFLMSVVVVFLLLRHVSSAAGTQRVQYHVLETLPLDNARLEAELNAYGQTGWELILVDIGNVTKPTPRFVFKRIELP